MMNFLRMSPRDVKALAQQTQKSSLGHWCHDRSEAANAAREFNRSVEVTGVIPNGAAFCSFVASLENLSRSLVRVKIQIVETFRPRPYVKSKILAWGYAHALRKSGIRWKQKLWKWLRKENTLINDFIDQLDQVQNSGANGRRLKMIPGMANNPSFKYEGGRAPDCAQTCHCVLSMTPEERKPWSVN